MGRNTLYQGDNLEILRTLADESVDLIYLDPPFNSNQVYNLLFDEKDGTKAAGQIKAFEDTWQWGEESAAALADVRERDRNGRSAIALDALEQILGPNNMMAYLAMMAPRLIEMRRILKSTGSLYLHCDPTASHYLKVLLDAVFEPKNFRNEIIWKRTSAHSSARRFGPVHDTILFFSKSGAHAWNHCFQPYDEAYLTTFFDQEDPEGRRYKRADLTGAGVRNGETGLAWRGIDITAKGRHWMRPPSALDRLDSEGRIHWPRKKGGMPRLKQYPEDLSGLPVQDVWTDLRPLHNLSAERIGFPTQKPKSLLERIISASSNEGDVVLDPFCGCGTAIEAAQALNRRWIGIDITRLAMKVIRKRLKKINVLKGRDYDLIPRPATLEDAMAMAKEDRYLFQDWVLTKIGATCSGKGADRGIDGRLFFPGGQIIVSVKSGKAQPAHLRDLLGVVTRERAQIGGLVTLQEPTQAMRKETASARFYRPYGERKGPRFPKLQILTVEQIFQGMTFKYPTQMDLLDGLPDENRLEVSDRKPPKAAVSEEVPERRKAAG